MAREAERPAAGTSRFGSRNKGIQGEVHIESGSSANKPALLALDATDSSGNVTTYYLWVDSAGKLRISSAKPTAPTDSAGTVVGSQS